VRVAGGPTILITGAAGNLGSLLARHLAARGHSLRLMYYRKPLPDDLANAADVRAIRADLAEPRTIPPAVEGADIVVHFAGVLFAPRPDRFLPETNTRWFSNLLEASLRAGVGRVILTSFPQVEGPTSFEQPATGRPDRHPISVHARTRLEEERLLLERTRGTATTPIVLRLGMIYGRGILMIDAARWLARRHLLCVWREPTLLQLLSTADYLQAAEASIVKPGLDGIYHVGDEQPVTLQQFLDSACDAWGCRRPMRVPMSLVRLTAWICETSAMIAGTRAPLTRDFVRLGQVPHWGDTRRAREELVPRLRYPTLVDGLPTL
jgi:nucleoside-diphosphate-sugar epimerase